MKQIKDNCYKGTRILVGNDKRNTINKMVNTLVCAGYTEIIIPIIQHADIFQNKVGEENNNMMYNFKDRGDRDLCLAPEYTAVVQKLAKSIYKYEKDVKLFYVAECFRGEKPQAGRYRQFTQLGVEIINPTKDYSDELIRLARQIIMSSVTPMDNDLYNKSFGNKDVSLNDLIINTEATRGLDYYTGGKGFEIGYKKLGAQSQICGGGSYDGGVGFALGVDRIILMKDIIDGNDQI